MLTTAQSRAAWSPPCSTSRTQVTLNGGAVVTVDPRIQAAVAAMNQVMARFDYRCTPPDCGAYVCRPITGGTGYSLHAYGIAIDINWTANPYFSYPAPRAGHCDMPAGMPEAICAICTNNGKQVWGWGGFYSSIRDFMHYEIVCTPADLATGIAGVKPLTKAQKALYFIKAGQLARKRPYLHPGSRGKSVMDLQRILGIEPTGSYEAGTTHAVEQFQAFFHIKTNAHTRGRVGRRTWQWLIYSVLVKGRT